MSKKTVRIGCHSDTLYHLDTAPYSDWVTFT